MDIKYEYKEIIFVEKCETNNTGEFSIKNISRVQKRILDISLSLIGILVSLPLMIVLCIFVWADTRGFPIFVQKRMGLKGKIFNMYKIRSMHVGAEAIKGPVWAEVNDSRVTRVGRVLRKTHLDELPQLFNVFAGQMSIVGPRPEREFFYKIFSEEIPEFSNRLCVKPGLTGLAQVNGGYDLAPREKLFYDIRYIKDQSLLLDMKIIFKTVVVVFKPQGAR